MKQSIILTLLFTIFVFAGCSSTQPKVASNETKFDSLLTSKQIEEKLNWKYCEESN